MSEPNSKRRKVGENQEDDEVPVLIDMTLVKGVEGVQAGLYKFCSI
jgi:hypothetical protein